MIIEMVLNVVYSIFNVLTTPINIPELPSEVMETMNDFLQYISMGVGIISNYTHYSYLIILFGIIIAIDIGISLYKLVMFVLRKIPFLNIN